MGWVASIQPFDCRTNGQPFSIHPFSIAFPMAEVISTYIPVSFYEVSAKKGGNIFFPCNSDFTERWINENKSCLSFKLVVYQRNIPSANPFNTQSATYQILFLSARERRAIFLKQKKVKADYCVLKDKHVFCGFFLKNHENWEFFHLWKSKPRDVAIEILFSWWEIMQ